MAAITHHGIKLLWSRGSDRCRTPFQGALLSCRLYAFDTSVLRTYTSAMQTYAFDTSVMQTYAFDTSVMHLTLLSCRLKHLTRDESNNCINQDLYLIFFLLKLREVASMNPQNSVLWRVGAIMVFVGCLLSPSYTHGYS